MDAPAQEWRIGGRGCDNPFVSILPAIPRLRACRPALVPVQPPARSCWTSLWLCGATKSTRWGCQSDKPFSVRDIQFDDPQIGILILSAIQVFIEVLRIVRILLLGTGPFSTPVELRHSLEDARISAVLRRYNQDSPGLSLTFAEDRREPAFAQDAADQPGDLEVGRKTWFHS